MQLLTQDLRDKLLVNGRQQQPLRGTRNEMDFVPVVKLFTPDAGATWHLSSACVHIGARSGAWAIGAADRM